MFQDRKEAGERLGAALQRYKEADPLVLAIPRGGVEVGYEAAKALEAEFDLLICRKLPFPDNPESGFGAIAEDGTLYINEAAAAYLSEGTIIRIIQEQKEEIRRRIKKLRGGRPITPIEGRTVILVDDGIAMGSTMTAALRMCRKEAAASVVVAAPVAGARAIAWFGQIADDVVVLESPPDFHAVAQVYARWYDVSDEEVLEIMRRARS